MAFPTVLANVSGFVSSTAGLTANATITLPSTIDPGDMLLAIFTANGGTGTTVTWNSSAVGSWTQISSNVYTTNYITQVWQRIADGTEDGKQLRVDLDSARPSAWIVYRISGYSSLSPNVAVANSQSSSVPADPPNLAPPWSPPSTDVLWFAVLSHARLSTAITDVPINYTSNVNVAATGGAAGRVSLFSTQRNLNASSEDPSTYTASSSGSSMGLTIGVRGIGVQVTSANSPIYAASSERLQGTNLSGVTNVLLTSGTRNVQTIVTSTDSGNVYFTVPSVSTLVSSNIKFQSVTLTANDSGSSGSVGSSLLPNTGYGIHDVTDTSQVGVATCIYYGLTPSVVVGDQFLYDNSADVTIDSQGFPTLTNGRTSFTYYVFDTTDETWGAAGTYSAGSSPPASSNVGEWIFQSEQFVEVGKTNGISPSTVMRMFANGAVQLGEMIEVAGTSSMRLFANGMVQVAEFIEV